MASSCEPLPPCTDSCNLGALETLDGKERAKGATARRLALDWPLEGECVGCVLASNYSRRKWHTELGVFCCVGLCKELTSSGQPNPIRRSLYLESRFGPKSAFKSSATPNGTGCFGRTSCALCLNRSSAGSASLAGSAARILLAANRKIRTAKSGRLAWRYLASRELSGEL